MHEIATTIRHDVAIFTIALFQPDVIFTLKVFFVGRRPSDF